MVVLLLLLFSVSDTVSGNTGSLPAAFIRSDGAAGVFQVTRIKWCVWGVEIVPCDQGGYLARAAALWGDQTEIDSVPSLSPGLQTREVKSTPLFRLLSQQQ